MEDMLDYYDRVGDRPNNIVVTSVENFVSKRNTALDLGSGNFRDSRYLKERAGFQRVVAVDPFDEATAFRHDGIEYHPLAMQDFPIEEGAFDLIIACNSLFYLSKHEVKQLIARAVRGLAPEGVFSFNVLGEKDGWIKDGLDRSYFTRAELESLIAGYGVYAATEVDLAPQTPGGKKWHMFSLSVGVFDK